MGIDQKFHIRKAQTHSGLFVGRCFPTVETLEYMVKIASGNAVAGISDMDAD